MLLLALALGTFQASSVTSISEMTAILLLNVSGALAGASLGTWFGHPLIFGGVGAVLVLPALIVIKMFNC